MAQIPILKKLWHLIVSGHQKYCFINYNFAKSNSGFPKVGQVTPFGVFTDFHEAMIREVMSHNLKLTLDIL